MRTTIGIIAATGLVLAACANGDSTEETTGETDGEPAAVQAGPSATDQQLAQDICTEALAEGDTPAARGAVRDLIDAADTNLNDAELRELVNTECLDDIQALGPPPSQAPEPDEPSYHEPTVDDFELDVVVTSQRCFGSAGCNVQFHVELAYLGWETLDPDGEWNLTYEIEGGEDIYINTLSIHGEQYSTDQTERISTPSSDAELTAVITRLASR